MGAKKKKPASTQEDHEAQIEQLLTEYATLKDNRDAIDTMLEQRKERLLMLMSESGIGKFKGKSGEASFTRRRSFKVHDTNRLAELMSHAQLASLAKITADVYDAAEREDIPLNEAVTVGISESLTVSRASTKEAKERRKRHIEESKRQAEKRVENAIKLLRS